MDMLAVFCSECTESGMIVSLGFDSILIAALARAGLAVRGGGDGRGLTAPYLETCRTNSDASLNRGRGTMVNELLWGGCCLYA